MQELLYPLGVVLLGGLNLRQVHFAEFRRLLPGMLAGALVGLWLNGMLDARWPLLVLGVYVAAVGAQALQAPAAPRPALAVAWSYAAGGAIGVVEMLFGTAGPLVVAWLSRRLPDARTLRATTPLVITASACSVLLTMACAGRLSHADLWVRWVVLLGAATAGVVIGNRCARRADPEVLRKVICGLLIVSGLTLALHAVRRG